MPNSLSEIIENSARGGFFLIAGNVLANLILALGLFVVGRLLGPEQYGLYSLAFVFPAFLLLFVDFGINSGLIRYCASFCAKGQEGRAAKFLKYGLIFEVAVSLMIFVISFTFSDHLATYLLNRPDAGFYIRMVSLAIPFQVAFATINASFVALNKMKTSALTTTLQAATKVSVSIGLVLLAFGVIGAIAGQVASYLVASTTGAVILFSVYYRRLNKNNQAEAKPREILTTLVTYGFPLYISAILGGFVPQYQGIVLAWFTSNAEIGNLKATTNLLTIVGMITGPITTTLFPAFSKLDPEGNDIKRFFQISVKYTTLLIVPAAVLLLLFSKEIVNIAYGASYASAPFFLSVYSTSYLMVCLGSLVLGSFFNGTGNTKTTFKMLLVSLALTIPLTPILTYLYGVIGLIIAHLMSSLSANLYGLHVAKSRFKIKLLYKNLLRIYAISALSATPVIILLYVSRLWWLWNVILGFVIYLIVWVTLVPVAGILQAAEIQKLETLLPKNRHLRKALTLIVSYEKRLLSKTQHGNKS